MKIKNFLAFIILGVLSLESTLISSGTTPFQPEFNPSYDVDVFAQMNKMNFYGQASQDKFVYSVLYGLLGKQDQGYYLEIGAGDPIIINNSYFLEKTLNWNGTSIDIAANLANRWYSVRNNPLLIEDATKTDYEALLEPYPPIIDYLSLDIDGFYCEVLKKIPFDKHIFKIITIEHDFYRYGELYRAEERQILSSLGYHMLCADVVCGGLDFEDWWIHPSIFPPSVLSELLALDLNTKDHTHLMRILEDKMSQGSLN